MAPIKFEEQIKDKLEKRTVSPSAEAWSKLSQQLDADDSKNKTSKFWWLGIAASIAALVFLTLSYFGNSSENEIDTIIVDDTVEEANLPSKTSELTTNKDEAIKEVAITPPINEEEPKEREVSIFKTKISHPSEKSVTQIKSKKTPTETKAIENIKSQELNTASQAEFNSVAKVINEVKSETKNTVTDQHIDSLLKVAHRELLIDKALKRKSTIVDADALLQDVEEEMGQSFRTRIYETLKNSYKSVKSAVAQRNE